MSFFKRPLSEPSSADEVEQTQKPRKRAATIYDAVAGRVSQWGFIESDSAKYSAQPLRPDEILYRSRNAPIRYEETDHYFAHRNLPADRKLPSSDLITSLHAYISEFYGRSEEQPSQKVWKSMDETALIALGILMEETAREILGETGYLAFLESDETGYDVETKRTARPALEPNHPEQGVDAAEEENAREGDKSQSSGYPSGSASEASEP